MAKTTAAIDEQAETRLSVIVPPELKADLESLAAERERSLSAEIRLALRRHVLASQTLATRGDDHLPGGQTT